VINKKHLRQTLQSGQGDTLNAATIWENRERLAYHLTGHEPAPVQPIEGPAMFCPKCGKKMVEKIAKGGKLVAGKPFWVCRITRSVRRPFQ
jgi:ssDNA-binding Zn-finger/Zn-ribbon topoisomerase 1